MSRIIIEGKTVKLVKEEVIKEVPLDKFAEAFSENAPLVIPVLPENTRGIASVNGHTTLIIEQQPCRQTVSYKFDGRSNFNFNLHLPWTYFFLTVQNRPIVVENIGMFYAPTRITTEKSVTGWMSTPNVAAGDGREIGRMCTGEISVSNDLPLHQFVSELISQIWGGFFNQDHFNPNVDGSPSIRDAIKSEVTDNATFKKEYNALSKLPNPDAKEKARLNLLSLASADERIRYLYTWDRMSERMSNKDFVAELKFHSNWTYKKNLEAIGTMFRDI